MLNEIQNTLSPLLSDYSGYAGLIAFLAAFLETLIGVGYFLPGSTILLILGIFAGQGIVSLASIWLFAFAGAFGGDQFNYFLGRRYGDALLAKPWFHLPTELLGKTHLFFRRHGGISIFLGRFLPGIKEAIAFVAGSFGLRYRRFLFWEFFGALGWSIEFIGIGYLFSSSLSLAQIWLTRTGFVIVSLILFFLILYLLKRFIQHNAKPAWALLCSIGNSVKNNSDVKAWLKKYPKIVTFLKQRIDSSHFYGLPLTLLSLVFLYVLALFGGAVEDFINRAPIVAVDHIIANLTPPLRTPALTDFFTWVTLLGKTEVAGVFLLATALVLWLYAKSRYILSLILSVGGATVFMGLGKLAFHRPRPDVAIYVEHTYSFPSGHATIAVALYGFVAYLLMHFSKNLKTKLNIFFAATILILLIGLSRIYLAEHYLSDVYTGFLVGTLWLIVAIAFTLWLESRKRGSLAPLHLAKAYSIATALSFILFFGVFGNLFHYSRKPPAQTEIHLLDKPEALFRTPESHFTQSLLGMDTWPINLILVSDSLEAIKNNFQQAGWRIPSETLIKSLPLFWRYRKVDLTLAKRAGQQYYWIKIWKTEAELDSHSAVFVAMVVAVDHYRWQSIPKFTEDIDQARDLAVVSLEGTKQVKKKKTIQAAKAIIGKDILYENYFTNGKAIVLYLGS